MRRLRSSFETRDCDRNTNAKVLKNLYSLCIQWKSLFIAKFELNGREIFYLHFGEVRTDRDDRCGDLIFNQCIAIIVIAMESVCNFAEWLNWLLLFDFN